MKKSILQMYQDSQWFTWLFELAVIYSAVIILVPLLIKAFLYAFCAGVVLMSLNNK